MTSTISPFDQFKKFAKENPGISMGIVTSLIVLIASSILLNESLNPSSVHAEYIGLYGMLTAVSGSILLGTALAKLVRLSKKPKPSPKPTPSSYSSSRAHSSTASSSGTSHTKSTYSTTSRSSSSTQITSASNRVSPSSVPSTRSVVNDHSSSSSPDTMQKTMMLGTIIMMRYESQLQILVTHIAREINLASLASSSPKPSVL